MTSKLGGIMSIHVSQLFIYPVKSLQGISLESISVHDFGPKWDRRFMLVDDTGRFITQRQCPSMSQVPVVLQDNTMFIGEAENQISVQLNELNALSVMSEVSVWNDQLTAKVLPKNVNDWISNKLNRSARLCFIDDATHRQVDLEFAKKGDKTGFSDGFPFLILSEASLAFLSNEVGFNLDAMRFRPNIVVSGCEAFAEDQWQAIEINGIEFDIVKPCSRCVIPTINPATSEKQPEVMQVMLKHRKKGKQVYVGQNAIHRGIGELRIGDRVKILK